VPFYWNNLQSDTITTIKYSVAFKYLMAWCGETFHYFANLGELWH